MEKFVYRACKPDGSLIEDCIWADSQEEALERLRLESLLVESIERPDRVKVGKKAWKNKDIIHFAYEMELLLSSGIAMRRIMDLMAQRGHPRIPYASLREAIQRGRSLSAALEASGYPALAVALLKAGELSGNLASTFGLIRVYFEKQVKWREKMLGAMAYPSFLMLLMLVFTGLAIGFILPSFKQVFVTMRTPMPKMTQWLFAVGDCLHLYWGWLLLGLMLCLVLLGYLYTRTSWRLRLHTWWWRKGQMYQLITALQYTHILQVWALLLDSGISLLDTLKLTQGLWRNDYGEIQGRALQTLLQQGRPFHQALRDKHIGTAFIWNLVAIGEESGDLVAMMNHCSQYYESLLERYMTQLEKLLEPIMLSIMGLGVAFLVAAVMLPLFNSISAI